MTEIEQARIDAVRKVTDILKRDSEHFSRTSCLGRGSQWAIDVLENILAAANAIPGAL